MRRGVNSARRSTRGTWIAAAKPTPTAAPARIAPASGSPKRSQGRGEGRRWAVMGGVRTRVRRSGGSYSMARL